jgi:uncharacterized membrane protein HdeD (DUF308 family)
MATSLFLAKLIGPILLISGIAMLINRKSFDVLAEEILRSQVLVFLFGTIDLGLGLAIVLTHNLWVADWRVIITLLGWLMIVRGAARMLLPAQVKEFGTKLVKNRCAITASFSVVLVLGLVLSYFGYAR